MGVKEQIGKELLEYARWYKDSCVFRDNELAMSIDLKNRAEKIIKIFEQAIHGEISKALSTRDNEWIKVVKDEIQMAVIDFDDSAITHLKAVLSKLEDNK